MARIDPGRAIFAGLVDAQHRASVRSRVAWPPAGHVRLLRTVRIAMSAAPPSERIAFQPAMEMPRKRNWTSSQRINGAWLISFRSSAGLKSLRVRGALGEALEDLRFDPGMVDADAPETAIASAASTVSVRERRESRRCREREQQQERWRGRAANVASSTSRTGEGRRNIASRALHREAPREATAR